MELFIQIRDGQAYEHPIMGDNFRQAFPNIDPDNLPPNFARFERVPQPIPNPYEKNYRVQYEWVGSIVKDVWYCDLMTAEEKLAWQNEVKNNWAANGFASWTFNEETCRFDPPVAYPQDGKRYAWDEQTQSWDEVQA